MGDWMIDTAGHTGLQKTFAGTGCFPGTFCTKKGGEGVEIAVPVYLFTGNEVFVGLERLDSNTADLHNVLWFFERTILFPVVYDALGIGRPNALQGAEFIN
jgi:hypothetical protein